MRNTKQKCRPAMDDELRTAELIVTQAWSRRTDGTPGKGNAVLADVAKQLHLRLGLPIFAQQEVAEAITGVSCVGIVQIPDGGRSSRTANTWTVAAEQGAYCKLHGITRVIVIAHPYHMPRALSAYKELGLSAVPAPVPREWDRYRDPELIHWEARQKTPLPFLLREKLVTILAPFLRT